MMRIRLERPAALLALALLAGGHGASAAPKRERPLDPGLKGVAARRLTAVGSNTKPFVVTRPRGGVYLAWAQRIGERTAVYFSHSTDGRQLAVPTRLTPDGMDLDLGVESGPHIAVDRSGTIYVVWSAGSRALAQARPASGHGSSGGHGGKGGHPPRPGNLTVYFAKSSDDGRTFTAPRQVNDGPDGPERRFPTVTVDSRGHVYVVWLDKRKETAQKPGYSRVYFTRSTDGGQTFAPNSDITGTPEHPICHCCKLALATHPTEGIVVAFRNDCEDLRDMFYVQSRDGGETFSPQAPLEETRWIVPT
jgi:hypothetical protein